MYKKYKIICIKYKREDEKTNEDRTKRKKNKNTRFYGGKVTLKFWINQILFISSYSSRQTTFLCLNSLSPFSLFFIPHTFTKLNSQFS